MCIRDRYMGNLQSKTKDILPDNLSRRGDGLKNINNHQRVMQQQRQGSVREFGGQRDLQAHSRRRLNDPYPKTTNTPITTSKIIKERQTGHRPMKYTMAIRVQRDPNGRLQLPSQLCICCPLNQLRCTYVNISTQELSLIHI
eukprot:TRINITY_DN2988_c0_g1_i13.p1 TRINITY_DN2988_c0_g1~~TRINITY_DN2988_c0_g1_i13.p1  ORF type:complete len:142 (+),score=17.47 TRINITY_DN2988_c0_g1_i13:115-540(+)